MKDQKIEHITDLEFGSEAQVTGKKTTQLFEGTGRKIVFVELTNGDMLSKHKANEPISVLCLAGNGVFRAGDELEESQDLSPGTLITLDAGIPHDVTADDTLRLLVTKFKQY